MWYNKDKVQIKYCTTITHIWRRDTGVANKEG